MRLPTHEILRSLPAVSVNVPSKAFLVTMPDLPDLPADAPPRTSSWYMARVPVIPPLPARVRESFDSAKTGAATASEPAAAAALVMKERRDAAAPRFRASAPERARTTTRRQSILDSESA